VVGAVFPVLEVPFVALGTLLRSYVLRLIDTRPLLTLRFVPAPLIEEPPTTQNDKTARREEDEAFHGCTPSRTESRTDLNPCLLLPWATSLGRAAHLRS